MSGVYSANELNELATWLGAVEDWLRESSTARHSEDMADVVHKAWQVIDDLYDEQYNAEFHDPAETWEPPVEPAGPPWTPKQTAARKAAEQAALQGAGSILRA